MMRLSNSHRQPASERHLTTTLKFFGGAPTKTSFGPAILAESISTKKKLIMQGFKIDHEKFVTYWCVDR